MLLVNKKLAVKGTESTIFILQNTSRAIRPYLFALSLIYLQVADY